MLERMKPYRVTLALLLLVAYLGVQALTGERGLLSGHERDVLLEQRASQLAHLTEQRRDLETRVRYLRSDSLSKDLLHKRGKSKQAFDLGCCSIEVPTPADEP